MSRRGFYSLRLPRFSPIVNCIGGGSPDHRDVEVWSKTYFAAAAKISQRFATIAGTEMRWVAASSARVFALLAVSIALS